LFKKGFISVAAKSAVMDEQQNVFAILREDSDKGTLINKYWMKDGLQMREKFTFRVEADHIRLGKKGNFVVSDEKGVYVVNEKMEVLFAYTTENDTDKILGVEIDDDGRIFAVESRNRKLMLIQFKPGQEMTRTTYIGETVYTPLVLEADAVEINGISEQEFGGFDIFENEPVIGKLDENDVIDSVWRITLGIQSETALQVKQEVKQEFNEKESAVEVSNHSQDVQIILDELSAITGGTVNAEEVDDNIDGMSDEQVIAFAEYLNRLSQSKNIEKKEDEVPELASAEAAEHESENSFLAGPKIWINFTVQDKLFLFDGIFIPNQNKDIPILDGKMFVEQDEKAKMWLEDSSSENYMLDLYRALLTAKSGGSGRSYLEQAAKATEEIGDTLDRAIALNNIISAADQMKEPVDSYLEKSLSSLRQSQIRGKHKVKTVTAMMQFVYIAVKAGYKDALLQDFLDDDGKGIIENAYDIVKSINTPGKEYVGEEQQAWAYGHIAAILSSCGMENLIVREVIDNKSKITGNWYQEFITYAVSHDPYLEEDERNEITDHLLLNFFNSADTISRYYDPYIDDPISRLSAFTRLVRMAVLAKREKKLLEFEAMKAHNTPRKSGPYDAVTLAVDCFDSITESLGEDYLMVRARYATEMLDALLSSDIEGIDKHIQRLIDIIEHAVPDINPTVAVDCCADLVATFMRSGMIEKAIEHLEKMRSYMAEVGKKGSEQDMEKAERSFIRGYYSFVYFTPVSNRQDENDSILGYKREKSSQSAVPGDGSDVKRIRIFLKDLLNDIFADELNRTAGVKISDEFAEALFAVLSLRQPEYILPSLAVLAEQVELLEMMQEEGSVKDLITYIEDFQTNFDFGEQGFIGFLKTFDAGKIEELLEPIRKTGKQADQILKGLEQEQIRLLKKINELKQDRIKLGENENQFKIITALVVSLNDRGNRFTGIDISNNISGDEIGTGYSFTDDGKIEQDFSAQRDVTPLQLAEYILEHAEWQYFDDSYKVLVQDLVKEIRQWTEQCKGIAEQIAAVENELEHIQLKKRAVYSQPITTLAELKSEQLKAQLVIQAAI
jgi:hypothetical protein